MILNIGIVAPVKLLSGTILEGGADQVLLPENWSEKWVVGYRFVTSEPLMDYPEYTTERRNPMKLGLSSFYVYNSTKKLVLK